MRVSVKRRRYKGDEETYRVCNDCNYGLVLHEVVPTIKERRERK